MREKSDALLQYELWMEMYRHYLRLVIEVGAVCLGLIGAVSSFYMAHGLRDHRLPFAIFFVALFLPWILILVRGWFLARGLQEEIRRLEGELLRPFSADTGMLGYLLLASLGVAGAAAYLVISVVLVNA